MFIISKYLIQHCHSVAYPAVPSRTKALSNISGTPVSVNVGKKSWYWLGRIFVHLEPLAHSSEPMIFNKLSVLCPMGTFPFFLFLVGISFKNALVTMKRSDITQWFNNVRKHRSGCSSKSMNTRCILLSSWSFRITAFIYRWIYSAFLIQNEKLF